MQFYLSNDLLPHLQNMRRKNHQPTNRRIYRQLKNNKIQAIVGIHLFCRKQLTLIFHYPGQHRYVLIVSC